MVKTRMIEHPRIFMTVYMISLYAVGIVLYRGIFSFEILLGIFVLTLAFLQLPLSYGILLNPKEEETKSEKCDFMRHFIDMDITSSLDSMDTPSPNVSECTSPSLPIKETN